MEEILGGCQLLRLVPFFGKKYETFVQKILQETYIFNHCSRSFERNQAICEKEDAGAELQDI